MTYRTGFAALLIALTSTGSLIGADPKIDPASGGLAVLVNPRSAEAPASLELSHRFTIHCLTDNEAMVADLQKQSYARFRAEHWPFRELPHADNLVNVLIVYNAGSVRADEIHRVLAPLGSVWILGGRRRELIQAGLEVVGESEDGWVRFRKIWPKEIDEWTHFLHGVDGNCVANDTRVAEPRSMQWTSGPDWTQHHNRPNSLSAMVSARGRLYYINNDAPPSSDRLPDRWSLIARDAFNGVLLWNKPLTNWGWKSWSDKPVAGHGRFTQPPHIARTLVADRDIIYVTLGFGAAVSAIDGRTGEVLRTFVGTENTDEILVDGGRLYLAVHDQSLKERSASALIRRREGNELTVATKRMMAVDNESGSIIWESGNYVGISEKQQYMEIHRHLNPVLGDGKVFFITKAELVCLNAETGKEIWRRTRPSAEEHLMRYEMRATDMVSLVYHSGRIYFSQLEPTERIGWRDVKGTIHAFSAVDGQPLWNRVCASWGWGSPADILITQGLVWIHEFKTSNVQGIDPATGKVVRTTSNKAAFDNGHHHRCYRNKATTNFLVTSYRGVELIDWKDQQETSLSHWFRAACRYGLLPANGLIYNSPNPCECYVESKLNGFNALAARSTIVPVADADRRTIGPAFGNVTPLLAQDDDWPAFRHDTTRSGAAGTALSPKLHRVWGLDLGATPTAPVVAHKLVHLAVPERRQLIAVDPVHGKVKWSVQTAGQVDTPPTCHLGTVVYGTSDGYVTCRRAIDGVLVWQFLAAPSHRRIMSSGVLESSWPVHGSVVVEGNRVYVVAGRSSFLDGGFSSWVLDAATGTIISQVRIDTESKAGQEGKTSPREGPGMTTDLLVGNGESLFLRGRTVFSDISHDAKTPLLRPIAGFLNDTWFNRVSQWKCGNIPCGEAVVMRDKEVFSFDAFVKRSTDNGFFRPGTGSYTLSARTLIDEAVTDRKGKKNGMKKSLRPKWTRRVSVTARAMLLSGEVVILGGPPDTVDKQEPWKLIEGRGSGMLLILSATNGDQLGEIPLESPPVLNGMAAADGKLFVASQSGELICLESSTEE